MTDRARHVRICQLSEAVAPIAWCARALCAAAVLLVLLWAPGTRLSDPAAARAQGQAQAGCGFVLGFAALHNLLPQQVGACLEDQRFAANGNAEQRTTGGLLVWRKADNWTAFTDGFRTWINGPAGLQQRLNTERYPWESDAAGFPAPAVPLADIAAPVLAWYYPQFSQGWAADVANAQRAGIDALVVSQTTQRPGAPLFGSPIGQAVRNTPLRLTLGIETQEAFYPTQASLVAELRRILDTDARNPQFLRYQGKPVLVFYALPSVKTEPGQTPQQAWAAVRAQVDPQHASIWIGEGGDPSTTPTYLPMFDGLHLYSIAWAADPAAQLAGWAARVRRADPAKLWVATVMPGGAYAEEPGPLRDRDRQNGAYYRATWQGAIATQPAMVIVTSFNETAERTEIHPTPAWGTLYLEITREMATAWHG